MARPTTGIRPVDDLMGGLRLGDNVVWTAEGEATLDPFVSAFVRASKRAPALVYVSFHVSPAEVLSRLREVWDPERFLLVDCFTDGLGQSEETFARFYRTRAARGLRLQRVAGAADAAGLQAALADVERGLGADTRYVFDSLTGMQQLWGAEGALTFFLRTCPRLYDLRTVAYWFLDRGAHDASFLSRLTHVTQVVLDLRAGDGPQRLKVRKAEGRPPEVLGREVRFAFTEGRMRVLRETAGTREQIGERLRAQRLARGMSQADLAKRIGISASALSQAERGRAGLSGGTLTRAWEALGLAFGVEDEGAASGAAGAALGAPGGGRAPARVQVSRRGARPAASIAPGLKAEMVAEAPSGARVHLLTFAPGASGRRPPFITKRGEVAVVMSGLLEIRVGGAKETLQVGDAAVLTDEPLTAWRNPGPEEARVLWSILP